MNAQKHSEQQDKGEGATANMPGLEPPQFEKAIRMSAVVRKEMPAPPRTDLRSDGGNPRRRVGQQHVVIGFEEASPWVLLAITLLFISAKRKSLRPGGYLQRLVKRRARGERARRNRRALAVLNDPVLARNLEVRLEARLGGPDQAQAKLDSFRKNTQKTSRELEACGDGDDYDGDMGRAYSISLNQLLSSLSFVTMMAAMFTISHLVATNGTYFLVPMMLICVVINALDDYLIMRRYGGYPMCRFAFAVLRDFCRAARTHTNDGRDTYPGSCHAAGAPELAEQLLADSGEA